MKLLFLDMDGVLSPNASSNQIHPTCVRHLGHIVCETECKIVLTSSWRGIIHGGDMTPRGFEYMLRTHGLTSLASIIGTTRPDHENDDSDTRGKQISDWLRVSASLMSEPITRFVILDDDHIEGFEGKVVQTNASKGLTEQDADKAIEILNS